MKKLGLIIKILLIVIIIGIVAGIVGAFMWYKNSITAVSSTENKVVFEVKEGETINQILVNLKNNGLIKNEKAVKIYMKLNVTPVVQAGAYEIDKAWNVEKIIDVLRDGPNPDLMSIKITFLEGKHMRWIAKTIAANTNNTEDDVYEKLKDTEYINKIIEKYWFIGNSIKDENIYYSLEGYLFPDTYKFENKNVTVEEIFDTMLQQTEAKLEKHKEYLVSNNIDVHKVLTLASIIEAEASNTSDRAGVAGVFYNRLKKNMALGSDVTTYYAIKVDMSERDLRMSELNAYNPYNTRGPKMEGKLPVGPICAPSIDSIDAAVKPAQSDYLFFVADKNGKVYYAKTDAEHQKNISTLKSQGLWYTY